MRHHVQHSHFCLFCHVYMCACMYACITCVGAGVYSYESERLMCLPGLVFVLCVKTKSLTWIQTLMIWLIYWQAWPRSHLLLLPEHWGASRARIPYQHWHGHQRMQVRSSQWLGEHLIHWVISTARVFSLEQKHALEWSQDPSVSVSVITT